MSFITAGITMGLIIGAPIGTWIGNVLDWRYSFAFVAIISFITTIGVLHYCDDWRVYDLYVYCAYYYEHNRNRECKRISFIIWCISIVFRNFKWDFVASCFYHI
ncbi:hypothetical protein [Aneurinibacillus aneurinilyticus]|uniref:hypothetical protein n=1 Tax=Aneurinibacillus aneurinilyticus TaxID=1391 RepID=UPI003C6C473B